MKAVEPNRAVMFDPHPDDADFWSGGLTLLLARAGWEVHYVCCGETREETRQQAAESASILGARRHFLEIPLTGNAALRDQLRERAGALMRELRPKMAFTTAFTDYHVEHCELTRELVPILKAGGRFGFPIPEIYTYDSHEGKDPVEIFIDIADVFGEHMRALRCHRFFAKPEYGPEDNTLTRIKTGRSMMLGASLPHATKRSLHAEGYHIIWGDTLEISTLRLLFPDRFHYRPAAWLTSMWLT